eukprot:m.72156 g.72156  ORF g.72156 m.72156 type:complete len:50 (-) comp14241_c0_seq20:8-157(-)
MGHAIDECQSNECQSPLQTQDLADLTNELKQVESAWAVPFVGVKACQRE